MRASGGLFPYTLQLERPLPRPFPTFLEPALSARSCRSAKPYFSRRFSFGAKSSETSTSRVLTVGWSDESERHWIRFCDDRRAMRASVRWLGPSKPSLHAPYVRQPWGKLADGKPARKTGQRRRSFHPHLRIVVNRKTSSCFSSKNRSFSSCRRGRLAGACALGGSRISACGEEFSAHSLHGPKKFPGPPQRIFIQPSGMAHNRFRGSTHIMLFP